MDKKITKPTKKLPLWLKIFIGIILGMVGLVVIFYLILFGWMKIKSIKDHEIEKRVDIKFHQEIVNVPEVKVDSFQLWEGTSILNAEIKNKKVFLWYSESGIGIARIEPYTTSWDCFYIEDEGTRKSYAGGVVLELGKDSPYKKWFPFEVNNLRDLVNKHDQIVKILATFPKNPEMGIFHDRWWGDRQMVKNPNPDFVVHQKIDGKDAICDLFQ